MEEYKKQNEIYENQLKDLYEKKALIISQIIEVLDKQEELKKKYNVYNEDEDIFENIQPAQIDTPEENNEKTQSKRGRGRKTKQIEIEENNEIQNETNEDIEQDNESNEIIENDEENEEEIEEKPKRKVVRKTQTKTTKTTNKTTTGTKTTGRKKKE